MTASGDGATRSDREPTLHRPQHEVLHSDGQHSDGQQSDSQQGEFVAPSLPADDCLVDELSTKLSGPAGPSTRRNSVARAAFTDLHVTALALGVVAVCVAALLFRPGPIGSPWVRVAAAFGLVVATIAEHRVAFALCLISFAGSHATATALTLYDRHLDVVGRFEGSAAVITDPEPGRFGSRVALDVNGQRVLASVPDDAYVTDDRLATMDRASDLMVGDVVNVSMTVRVLDDRTVWDDRLHLRGAATVSSMRLWHRASGLAGFVNAPRTWLGRAVNDLDPSRASLIKAMVIGDDRDVSLSQQDRFRRSGLLHLMVVSGQNLSLSLAFLAPLLTRVRVRQRALLTAVVVLAYVAMARADPSICRAGASALMVAFGQFRGVRVSGWRALCLAVIAMSSIDPTLVRSVGFWLSCLASAGIVVLAPRIDVALERAGKGWLSGRGAAVRQAIAATCGAQACVAPVIFWIGGPMPLSAIVTNALAEPLAFVVTSLGMVLAALEGLVALLVPIATGPSVVIDVVVGAVAIVEGAVAGLVQLLAWFGSTVPIIGIDWWCLVPLIWFVAGRYGPVRIYRVGVWTVAVGVIAFAGWNLWFTPFHSSVVSLVTRCSGGPGPTSPAMAFGRGAVTTSSNRVVVIGTGASAQNVLAEWHRSRLGSVDTIVVSGGGRSWRTDLNEVASARSPSRLIVAGGWPGPAQELAAGRYGLGEAVLDVSDDGSISAHGAGC